MLAEALRAYFLAGALRLLAANRSLSAARAATPDTEDAIRALSPAPHCMLYHPSARIESHFTSADEIAAWSAELGGSDGAAGTVVRDAAGMPQLSIIGLRRRLDKEEGLWIEWLRSFQLTRQRLSFLPGGQGVPNIDDDRWPEIRRILIDEVFPHTRIAIINSDPRADDRPHFQPQPSGDNQFVAPRDIFTIFVSGNVMARGLTLEGLTTTLFLRSSNEPLADTQMQMQRWFGFRGPHLCWCRVFMFEDQLDLFRSYHENDEALRRELIAEMNEASGAAPVPLVLEGERFRATGKIANLRALPLCPGPDPFVRVVEAGQFITHNVGILANLLETELWRDVTVRGVVRGSAMDRRLNLLQAAELLESFRYSHHDPDAAAANHERWRSLEKELSLGMPEAPLFRPPRLLSDSLEAVSPPSCPYSIAAYLRLWNALLTRRARGLFPTDDRRKPWSMIDLNSYANTAPRFYVAVRYGSAGQCGERRLADHGVLRMDRIIRDGVLYSTWGSRNPGEAEDAYLGDQLFDYHVHGGTAPKRMPGEPLWRPRGSPGLLLFHVMRGHPDDKDAVTVGLALPAGGPDHIAALRPIGGMN